jgi:hypothetical protein
LSDDSPDDSSSDDSIGDRIMEVFDTADPELENKYERIKHDLENIELTDEERVLYDQLINSEQDYENITDLLGKSKGEFTNHVAKYNDLVQRLRNLKNAEEELDGIMNEADEARVLTTMYKQVDKVLRGNALDTLNRNKPWRQENIILLPL